MGMWSKTENNEKSNSYGKKNFQVNCKKERMQRASVAALMRIKLALLSNKKSDQEI